MLLKNEFLKHNSITVFRYKIMLKIQIKKEKEKKKTSLIEDLFFLSVP